MTKTRILLLGATGSIGTSTVDVVRQHSERFEIVGMVAGRNFEHMALLSDEFKPEVVCLTDDSVASDADWLAKKVDSPSLWVYGDKMAEIARELDYDVCLAAVTGAAGLPAVLEAAKRGKRIALANKEALVVAGPILTSICKETGSELLPVDSEHSAIFQCLRGESHNEIKRIILTASGGPFRTTPKEDLKNVTLEQALNHPTWKMGPKITVDSSTLFNKALEVIEARWLFDVERKQLDVVIHPQSVVHSMVEFIDGSTIAHLGPTDMKVPIQFALSYPDRISQPVDSLPWEKMSELNFEAVDYDKFPALRLGFDVAEAGGTLGAVFNAANEVAVARFLNGEIGYLDIYSGVAAACDAHPNNATPSLEEALEADRWAREFASNQ